MNATLFNNTLWTVPAIYRRIALAELEKAWGCSAHGVVKLGQRARHSPGEIQEPHETSQEVQCPSIVYVKAILAWAKLASVKIVGRDAYQIWQRLVANNIHNFVVITLHCQYRSIVHNVRTDNTVQIL
jgi:hypothetical protein